MCTPKCTTTSKQQASSPHRLCPPPQAAKKVDEQWRAVQAAKPGSVNAYLFKMATWVLRRQDPDEGFLRALPHARGARLEIRHPVRGASERGREGGGR